MPSDITDLSSEQLAELFTKLTAWADYIASELAVAQITERSAQRSLDLTENRLLVERMGSAVKGERITLVKAQISLDPTLVELSGKYEEAYAYRKLVEMLLSNHERDLALVSREITRRASDQRANRKDYGF
jgi:rRNA processing protein Krr1/Pno1